MTAQVTRFLIYAIAMAIAFLPIAPAVRAETLDNYRDHRRVILLFAADTSDERVARQIADVRPLLEDKDDRDLSLVQVLGTTVIGASDSATRLHQRFSVPAGAFTVLLIGKDGHVALRSGQPVDSERLAAIVDEMPMRQSELRRR